MSGAAFGSGLSHVMETLAVHVAWVEKTSMTSISVSFKDKICSRNRELITDGIFDISKTKNTTF